MIIYLASDHAGFELKQKVFDYLKGLHFDVVDLGPESLDEGDDYPDYVAKAAQEIYINPREGRAIVMGGSGQGEAIVANRFSHVRAALYYGGNLDIVKLSREHNDSNVLSLGARFVTEREAYKAIDVWLSTAFTHEERHRRRIDKIERLNLKK